MVHVILLFPLSPTNPFKFDRQSSILSTRKFIRNLGSLRAFCLKLPSLPSDLHSRRVRTFITVITAITLSCQRRVSKITISLDQTRPCKNVEVQQTFATPVLQDLKINTNVISTAPSFEPIMAHPHVASNSRRAALGRSKVEQENRRWIKAKTVWDKGCCRDVRNFFLFCSH